MANIHAEATDMMCIDALMAWQDVCHGSMEKAMVVSSPSASDASTLVLLLELLVVLALFGAPEPEPMAFFDVALFIFIFARAKNAQRMRGFIGRPGKKRGSSGQQISTPVLHGFFTVMTRHDMTCNTSIHKCAHKFRNNVLLPPHLR